MLKGIRAILFMQTHNNSVSANAKWPMNTFRACETWLLYYAIKLSKAEEVKQVGFFQSTFTLQWELFVNSWQFDRHTHIEIQVW